MIFARIIPTAERFSHLDDAALRTLYSERKSKSDLWFKRMRFTFFFFFLGIGAVEIFGPRITNHAASVLYLLCVCAAMIGLIVLVFIWMFHATRLESVKKETIRRHIH